jgi:pimeloyl-ACP methyl ester carboxylesterase
MAAKSGSNKSDVKRVVVFVHGSGPQSLDEDLSAITVPKGSTNLFFRNVADSFLKKNIASVRYNKRAYEAKKRIEANPEYKNSEEFKKYAEHPLEYFIKDCAFFVDYAQKEFPNAEVFILGHSEGTGIALNVAKDRKFVKGVILIGFSNESLSSSIFEQTVYRQLNFFTDLDKNRDGLLSTNELKGKDQTTKSIREQFTILDLNGDKKISLTEYKAGNYSNLIMRSDLYNQSYLIDEAKLPRPSDLIKSASFKILFLQGEYDNQTPAYFAQSVELINKLVWKKKDLRFVYFEKAGHALDPRDSINDFGYRVVPTETLNKIAEEVADY